MPSSIAATDRLTSLGKLRLVYEPYLLWASEVIFFPLAEIEALYVASLTSLVLASEPYDYRSISIHDVAIAVARAPATAFDGKEHRQIALRNAGAQSLFDFRWRSERDTRERARMTDATGSEIRHEWTFVSPLSILSASLASPLELTIAVPKAPTRYTEDDPTSRSRSHDRGRLATSLPVATNHKGGHMEGIITIRLLRRDLPTSGLTDLGFDANWLLKELPSLPWTDKDDNVSTPITDKKYEIIECSTSLQPDQRCQHAGCGTLGSAAGDQLAAAAGSASSAAFSSSTD